MYAIVATGGKQYKVSPGEKVRVEKLEGSVGDKVVLDKVLFISDSNAVGTPYIDGACVETELTGQGKSKKVIVYKYKSKKGYHKKNGHRQLYTELTIENISLNGEILAEYVPEEEEIEEAAPEAAEETEEAEEVIEESEAEEVSEEVAAEEVEAEETEEVEAEASQAEEAEEAVQEESEDSSDAE